MSARSLTACGIAMLLLVGAAPSAGSAAPTPEQEPAAQQASPAQGQDPPQPQQDTALDPDALGLAPPAAMTDEEEEALRLVEQILQEQEVILAGQDFVYRSEGRRDPFRNILQLRRRELVAPTQRPPGLAGFLISEVDVKATARFQGRWQAMLMGLDQRTYFAEVGTQLFDGRIIEIRDDAVVFEQEVEDMLGARSTREVTKKLNLESDG